MRHESLPAMDFFHQQELVRIMPLTLKIDIRPRLFRLICGLL